ncbi:MAG: T9SS type A sorting domain-containing protein [Bacteroidota bacterium]|jgi:hypothetical protein
MKKTAFLIILSLLVNNIVAQWYSIPMTNVPPPKPNANAYGALSGYIINHEDTVVGFGVAVVPDSGHFISYFYSTNRGQTFNLYYSKKTELNDRRHPPIILKTGKILPGSIFVPHHDISNWDTTTTGALFNNFRFNPGVYRRVGNYLEDSVMYYANTDRVIDDLYKTTNLGTSKISVLDSITSSTDNMLEKIFVFDKNHVWARRQVQSGQVLPSALRGLQRLYRTSNGGMSWTYLPTNIDTFNLPSFDVFDIHFVSPDTGFMAVIRTYGTFGNLSYQTEIYRTTNGGSIWTNIATIPSSTTNGTWLTKLFFINSKIGFAYKEKVFKTTNGGYTWIEQTSLPTSNYQEMSMTGNVIYVKTQGGGLYYTTTLGDASVGVEESNIKSQLSVILYPNPTNTGAFTLQWDAENTTPAKVLVYDIMGKQVFTHQYNNVAVGENQLSLQLNVPPGVYYLRMEQGGKQASRSVVISR